MKEVPYEPAPRLREGTAGRYVPASGSGARRSAPVVLEQNRKVGDYHAPVPGPRRSVPVVLEQDQSNRVYSTPAAGPRRTSTVAMEPGRTQRRSVGDAR
jgi:hypothetical protein